jgi:cysteine desulfurase
MLAKKGQVNLSLLEVNGKGEIDLAQLEELLKKNPKSLVSLMQGNNEIGNLNDLERIGQLTQAHGAFFHSDTVQTMGHYSHDLSTLPVDALVAGAHKFHGPKGVGFLYVRKDKKIHPFIHGGAQERNMRGGTENVIGIIGLAKALEISLEELAAHRSHIEKLKGYKIETELDRKLCEYIGRFNLAGVSEIELRSKGLLRGNTLLVSELAARAKV